MMVVLEDASLCLSISIQILR